MEIQISVRKEWDVHYNNTEKRDSVRLIARLNQTGVIIHKISVSTALYRPTPKNAPARAIAPAAHVRAAGRMPTSDCAPLTFAPVRFEAAELPQSWKLRKYAFVSDEGAQDEALPP